jgi:hypothetical protein
MRNVLVILGVIAISLVYYWIAPTFVSREYAPVISLIVVPLLFGALVGCFFVGRLWVKLALVCLLPVSHIVVFGGDPAKPGLENLIALIEVGPLWIGCVVAHMAARKKTESTPALH